MDKNTEINPLLMNYVEAITKAMAGARQDLDPPGCDRNGTRFHRWEDFLRNPQ